ncbi:MAG TPA: tetratricopeptide repeat protein [Candidatus Dormibacteraeota bacterium]|nr:tetratricopeptide repeat protein [Candidatus Dormibacteraeota bacterium]
MRALPAGTVTFLLTDVEGSTRRWEEDAAAMRRAMARHDELVASCLAAHSGLQVESGREGDSVLGVFTLASEALACTVELQRRFLRETWPVGAHLRVRIVLNSGEAEVRGGHYYGQAVYRCAGLLATAHGGQVLVSQSTRDLVLDSLPTDASMLDLGSHRLKDLERPEQIYQVVHPDLEADFPPLRSLDAYRHNLPSQPNSFIGRWQELVEVKRALGEHSLLTLSGAGGSGKTRLARQAAADLVDGYPDGVWLVDLAPLSDSQHIVPSVMRTLGRREEPGRPLADTLIASLRTQHLLLILDNCEHLVAAVASLSSSILAECPEVRILATSREPLRIAGEAVWPVPPLTVGTEAVDLLADRARAVRPGFQLQDHRADVEEICRRLDGIPLAIELAAARTNVLSPAEILARLEDRFRLLTSSPRTAAARHRTLRAAVDWSYDLLDEQERALFRRLSVFAGGFSLDAVEAVCTTHPSDRGSVLHLLGRLVEQSLVIIHDAGHRQTSTRYGLLETLHEYGREKLEESHETRAIRRQHAAHFLALAEAAAPKLKLRDGLAWLERLDRDQDNLRAAFEESAGSDPDTELRLAAALWHFWDAEGGYAEGRARLTAALSRGGGPSQLRAEAMRGAGFMAWAQGDHISATSWSEMSLELCRRLKDREGEGMCLQQLGQIAFQQEDFARARLVLQSGLEVAAELRDEYLASLCRFRLGMIALFDGDIREAARLLAASLESGRQAGHEEMVVMSLLALGHVALREGRLDEAGALLSESLVAWRDRGGPRQIASLLEAFAGLAAAQGNAPRALRLAASAEALRKEIAVAPASAFQRDMMERLRPARESLGDKARADASLSAPMSREEAIAYALGEPSIGLTTKS